MCRLPWLWELSASAAVPVEVFEAPETRFPPAVERAAYLIVAEAADRGKHSSTDPTIVARLLRRPRASGPLDRLTERERKVLELVAEGLSNRAIATRRAVTERTIETEVTHVFNKLGLAGDPATHRRVQAVLAFLRGPT